MKSESWGKVLENLEKSYENWGFSKWDFELWCFDELWWFELLRYVNCDLLECLVWAIELDCMKFVF